VLNVHNTEQADQYCFRHVNGVVMIGLAPSHYLFTKKYKIKSIKFQGVQPPKITENQSYHPHLLIKPRGKKRKDTKVVDPNSLLCEILCETPEGTQESVRVYSTLKAKLIELNDLILFQPQLIQEQPMFKGFIAILDPNFGTKDGVTFKQYSSDFKSKQEYEQIRKIN
jgi:hypothetical protein